MDFLKPYGLELLESFVDPVVVHHPKGHTIPRLGSFTVSIHFPSVFARIPIYDFLIETLFFPADEKGLETVLSFIERIQKMLLDKEEK